MGVSIDISKIYAIIRDTGKPQKADVIRCLNMIALEAEELCNTWGKIITLATKKGNSTKNEKDQLINTKLFGDSTPFYGRIINFYRNISLALENKLEFDWIETIYNHVTNVILHQKDIKQSLDGFNKIKLSLNPLYLSTENNGRRIKDLDSSLLTLQNEVATLKSLPGMIMDLNVDELIK